MPTLLLLRHGLTELTGPVLAGHSPVPLDDRGRAQAKAAAARIAAARPMRVVSSPLPRCVETAQAVLDAIAQAGGAEADTLTSGEAAASGHAPATRLEIDERLVECQYGDWTGKPISELTQDPLWPTIQVQPSAVRFPGGESMPEMSARAIAAIRDINASLDDSAVWVACSHGDIIKAILADALGMHLDSFQRIAVDPCSVSVVRYTSERPYVLRSNDSAGDLAAFAWRPETTASQGATVGGGAGSGSV